MSLVCYHCQRISFFIDRLHEFNHSACCSGYKLSRFPLVSVQAT